MNWKYYDPKFEYEEMFEDSAWPWSGHKYFSYDLISNLKPKRIVELGTHYGTSLWAFSQAVKDQNIDTEINAIDTWEGEKHAGFYGEEVFETVNEIKSKFYSELKINLIRKTFDEAVSLFEDNSVDILHIDGLHTYEAVKHDFENWLPKVKKSGIILFHDIKVREDDFGVYKLWEELREKYVTIEFPQSYGLGVLFLNKTLCKEIKLKEKEWQMHYSYIHETKKIQVILSKDQEIKTKSQELQSKDQEIKTKSQELQSKDQEIKTKSQELQSKDEEIVNLNLITKQKDEIINQIYNSSSWKVTFPIRFLKDNFLKLKELVKKVLIVLKRDGLLIFFKKLKKFIKKLEISENLISDRSDEWLKYQQNLNKIEPLIINKIKEISFKPLISIIVPVYNTPEIMLRQMLESVKDQLYPNWELCITDDGSSRLNVKKILKEYMAKDKRIKLYLELKNKGVSHASNKALEMVTGEFVVLLDHDDVLEKQALFRVAESILEDDPDMVYSDEVLVASDLITVKRFSYRPMFSSEFLRSHPYIVHMVGFKTQLLKQIGGFDEKLNISQDYDLILRASEKAQTIVHIPEILYRWRIHSNSSGEQKMQEVMETSRSVLKRHMERCHEVGDVCDGAGFNLFDMRYKLINNLKVAIIIPTKNHGKILRQCIDSIRSTVLEIPYDIVVVDHESNDPETLDYFLSISSKIKILRYKGSFNFSTINNWAVSQLKDEYSHYLFCNNDIEAIRPGWLERMMELGQKASVGIVGAKLFYPDRKTIQHAGVCIGSYGCAEHYGKFLSLPENSGEAGFHEVLMSTHEVSAVTAACLLIQKKVFKQVLGFDESLAVGFGDVDLCLRVLDCGYKILYCPHAELIHHESYTRGKSISDPHPEDSKLFLFKWKKQLKIGDAYFNPGLSLMSTSWQTKIPLNYTLNIGRRVFKKNATFSE